VVRTANLPPTVHSNRQGSQPFPANWGSGGTRRSTPTHLPRVTRLPGVPPGRRERFDGPARTFYRPMAPDHPRQSCRCPARRLIMNAQTSAGCAELLTRPPHGRPWPEAADRLTCPRSIGQWRVSGWKAGANSATCWSTGTFTRISSSPSTEAHRHPRLGDGTYRPPLLGFRSHRVGYRSLASAPPRVFPVVVGGVALLCQRARSGSRLVTARDRLPTSPRLVLIGQRPRPHCRGDELTSTSQQSDEDRHEDWLVPYRMRSICVPWPATPELWYSTATGNATGWKRTGQY